MRNSPVQSKCLTAVRNGPRMNVWKLTFRSVLFGVLFVSAWRDIYAKATGHISRRSSELFRLLKVDPIC